MDENIEALAERAIVNLQFARVLLVHGEDLSSKLPRRQRLCHVPDNVQNSPCHFAPPKQDVALLARHFGVEVPR